MVKKSKEKEIVDSINQFYKENGNLGEIIANHLKEKNLKSIRCYSMGGCRGWCEDVIDSLVFLRVGFMTDGAFRHHGDENEKVLCALGYRINKHDPKKDIRVIEKFDLLPMPVKIEIFRTCFSKFEYAPGYNNLFKKLTANCRDFDRLKPTFKSCYFADHDNSCHEIVFAKEWDERGRAEFEVIDKPKIKVHFPEKGLFNIANGGVEQWGFDYAFSFDKELLRNLCRGGFSKDYTLKNS